MVPFSYLSSYCLHLASSSNMAIVVSTQDYCCKCLFFVPLLSLPLFSVCHWFLTSVKEYRETKDLQAHHSQALKMTFGLWTVLDHFIFSMRTNMQCIRGVSILFARQKTLTGIDFNSFSILLTKTSRIITFHLTQRIHCGYPG